MLGWCRLGLGCGYGIARVLGGNGKFMSGPRREGGDVGGQSIAISVPTCVSSFGRGVKRYAAEWRVFR